jgi:TPR repeat protein
MLSSCCLKAFIPAETHVAYVQRKIEEQDCIVQAALAGDPTADAAYLRFFLGTGNPTESSQLRKHALQGYAAAQYRLSSGLTTSERLDWLIKAATGGWPDAQYWLGLAYLDTRGESAISKYLTQNSTQGLKWLKALAANTREIGVDRRWQAHGLIAIMYLQGDMIPMDYAEAFRWASEGAKNRDYASAGVLARRTPMDWASSEIPKKQLFGASGLSHPSNHSSLAFFITRSDMESNQVIVNAGLQIDVRW